MIEILQSSTPDQIEVRYVGKVTQSDYESVLVPEIEAALTEFDTVRMLVVIGDDFESFDLGAAWADTKMGLSHWRGFDRLAIVTDTAWVSIGARSMAMLFPCPLQVFSMADIEPARRWLRESLGSLHLTELGGTAIHLQLLGKLDPDAYAKADERLAAHVRETGGLRLLLDLREFDGWQGVSALGAHLNVAREYAGGATRIAMVGDKAWQHMAERVAGTVLKANTQFFDSMDLDAAKAWVTKD